MFRQNDISCCHRRRDQDNVSDHLELGKALGSWRACAGTFPEVVDVLRGWVGLIVGFNECKLTIIVLEVTMKPG